MTQINLEYFGIGTEDDGTAGGTTSTEWLAMGTQATSWWEVAAFALNEWLVGRTNGTAPLDLPDEVSVALENFGIALENNA